MAQDNAAQAIKDLQKSLEAADNKIIDLTARLDKYNQVISNMFFQSSLDARKSIDDVIDYITKKAAKVTMKEAASPFEELLGLNKTKEAIAANKALSKAQEEFSKAQRQARVAESKAAYKAADKEAIANLRQQIQIKQQIARIDHDRQIRAKSGSQATAAQIAAERQQYASLQSQLTSLVARQKELNRLLPGITAMAQGKTSGFAGTAQTKEAQRYLQALQEIERQQGKNNQQLKQNKNTLDSMLPTIKRLASAFGVAFSVRGLAQFGKKLIETRGEFEMQQVALRSILQNKQLADEIWDKTMRAALQSPFTAMQLTTYTKQLAAYRIETDKLFDTTKRLADVSAGLGVDMQRLILAYGQVKAANYLRASEIRQFTEAGVNILGELRDYFNEFKGMSVNTAEVMEMVTKRMVKFEDVEAIFKRMTDQGGIFYNMQYVQSQTVKGQINKLHDAYQQMLNSMGKANQGTLKNMVSVLNNIVKNWRTWAVVLKSIGWGALIGFLTKTSVALKLFEINGVKAGKAADYLSKNIQKIGQAFAANWATLSIAAVTALVAALFNLDKKMKETNKEIDEQNLRLYQTRKNFDSLKSRIEENNDVIRKGGTDTKKLTDAQKSNESIMKKLGDEYPQMADKMKIATDGIIEMNGAIDENIRKLNEQMMIQNSMKQSNWFSDSDKENLEEYEVELSNINRELLTAKLSAEMIAMRFELAGRTADPLYKIYKDLSELDWGGDVNLGVDAFKSLNRQFKKTEGSHGLSLYEVLGVQPWDMKANWSENRVIDLLEKNNASLKVAYMNGIKDNAEYLKEINSKYDKDVMKFVRNNAELVNKGTAEGINKANEVLIKTLGPQTEEMRIFLNNVLNKLWDTVGVNYLGSATDELKTTTETETPEEKQSKIDAAWRRRIGLLEEMKKRYDELSKSAYGFTKSENDVRKAFNKSFGEIFKGTGISMSQIDFTSMEGMKKSTELALSKAKGVSDAVREEIMKKIDSYGAQITIDAQVRIREDFGRQMEAALGDYEITLELDKLNLPKGLAEQLWGVSKTQLPDLRAQLTDMYNGLRDENGQLSEDAFKDYQNYLKKVDELERKQQRERLKDYSKYLEAQYSDRVKLEMEYVRKLAGLEATSIPETQKKEIREGLRKEFLEKSRKQDFEDFKGSEFYVQMMEDLEKQGSASLQVMKEKLLEMRANAENLSPRALKEVVKALEKIDDIERSRNKPLSRLTSAMKDLRHVDMEDTFKSLAANQEQLANYEAQERELERMIMLENERVRLEKQNVSLEDARTMYGKSQIGLDNAQKNLRNYKSSGTKQDATLLAQLEEAVNNASMQVETWQLAVEALSGQSVIGKQKYGSILGGMSLEQLKKTRDELKKQKKELQGRIDKEEDLVRVNKELQLAWQATWESVKDWGTRIQGVFDGVMEHVEYFTDDTYGMIAAWKEFGDTSVSAMNDLVSGIQAYQEANANAKKAGLATGLLTANGLKLAMAVLSVIIKVVQAIAKLHDAKLDKQIEIQQDKIDSLSRAYDRLEKSIEKTFEAAKYMRDYNEMAQNINEQIHALNEQLNAEEDKKKTDSDKVQGYKDAIQDAEDKLEELRQKQIETFGGIGENSYRSAAEEFVSAWKEAFLETGDGLQGLQDHFDEFLNEWFVKQATMRIAGSTLEPLFRQIDDAVDQYSEDGTSVTANELEKIRNKFGTIAPELAKNLEDLYKTFGIGGEGSLSGLAAGIQGMTEEQANVLESHWRIVKENTFSIDAKMSRIIEILGGGGDRSNPQLTYLANIEKNTGAIYSFLQSVAKMGHTESGWGIKVFVN